LRWLQKEKKCKFINNLIVTNEIERDKVKGDQTERNRIKWNKTLNKIKSNLRR